MTSTKEILLSQGFKPMLAVAPKPKFDLHNLPYPLIGSPKIDGIRCCVLGNQPLSRKLLSIPNRHIFGYLAERETDLFDGELTVGDKFTECTSGIMSYDGEPDFKYHVFDFITNEPYEQRLGILMNRIGDDPRIVLMHSEFLETYEEMMDFEAKCLNAGFEGVCLRKPNSPYKFGRSTLREGYLIKLKRFEDSEALVVDFVEQYKNTNPAEKDHLGHTKRSKTLAGREGKGVLGAIVVQDLYTHVQFEVASGFDDDLRKEIWDNQDLYLGKILRYKYQPYGVKDKPRVASFLGFRHEGDL